MKFGLKWPIVTALVAIFVTLMPDIPVKAQTDPKPKVTLIEGCFVIVIGGIFVYVVGSAIVKLCNKIPKTDPPPPAVTNNPPPNINWTNRFGSNWHGLYPPPNWHPPSKNDAQELISLKDPLYFGMGSVGYTTNFTPIPYDTTLWTGAVIGGTTYQTTGIFSGSWTTVIQASTNLVTWEDRYRMVFFDDIDPKSHLSKATLMNVYSNGVCIWNALYSYPSSVGTNVVLNYVPTEAIKLGSDRPNEFYRAVSD